MPGYDIYSSNISKKPKLVYGNCPDEATGRYRERYKIGDDEELYTVLRHGSETVQEATDVAATVHSAATSVFVKLKEAERFNDQKMKVQLSAVLVLMNRAYAGLFTFADDLDDELRKAQLKLLGAEPKPRKRTRRTQEKQAS